MSNILVILLIGFVAGWLSGLVGIGGGVIIIPALIYFAGFSIKDAQGTSLAALVPPIGIVAAYIYYKHGNVQIKTAALLAAAFVVGGYLGAKTNLALSSPITEKVFAVTLIAIAVKMLFFK